MQRDGSTKCTNSVEGKKIHKLGGWAKHEQMGGRGA